MAHRVDFAQPIELVEGNVVVGTVEKVEVIVNGVRYTLAPPYQLLNLREPVVPTRLEGEVFCGDYGEYVFGTYHKFVAIKLMRERLGSGLKETKDALEAWVKHRSNHVQDRGEG